MNDIRFVLALLVVSVFGVLAFECTGCPTPSPPAAVAIVGPDGAPEAVTPASACANMAAHGCVAPAGLCSTLQGMSPIDFLCLTTKTTRAELAHCAGVGSACSGDGGP